MVQLVSARVPHLLVSLTAGRWRLRLKGTGECAPGIHDVHYAVELRPALHEGRANIRQKKLPLQDRRANNQTVLLR